MQLKATLSKLGRKDISIISGKKMSQIEYLKHKCDGYYSTTFHKAISTMLLNVLEEDAYSHSEGLERGPYAINKKYKNNFQEICQRTKKVYDEHNGKIDTEFLYEMARLAVPEVFKEYVSFRDVGVRIPGNMDFYSPPDPIILHDILDDFAKLMNSKVFDTVKGTVKRALLFHFWFVMIHPFADGNGRTARHIQNIILAKRRLPPVLIMMDERDEYLDLLEMASISIKGYSREVWSYLYKRQDTCLSPVERNKLLVNLYFSPTEKQTAFFNYLVEKIVASLNRILDLINKDPNNFWTGTNL